MPKKIFHLATATLMAVTSSILGGADFSTTFRSSIAENYPLPVAFSVPFAEGSVTSLRSVGISAGGNAIPQQWRELAKWPNGSVKWAQVICPAAANYQLASSGSLPPVPDAVSAHKDAKAVEMVSGSTRLRVAGDLATLRSGERELSFGLSRVTTVNGETLPAQVDSLEVLESGPMRAVVRARGFHRSKEKAAGYLRFDVFLTLNAGAPIVEIEHTLRIISGDREENLKNEMMRFHSAVIPVRFPGGNTPESFAALEESGNEITLEAGNRLFQWEDFAWKIEDSERQGERTNGVFVAKTKEGAAFAAVRDFWQQYPKGFTARPDGFDIDLYPGLRLDGKNPYEKRENEHVWYFYLRSGEYELRQGAEKSHRFFLGWSAKPGDAIRSATALLTIPVVLPSRDYVEQTKTLGALPVPMSGGLISDWDQAFLDAAKSYFEQQKSKRWYGMLNWGDWNGERGYNWCNHEYDLPQTFFKAALRFENPDFLREAIRENAHRRDVDVVHEHADPSKAGVNWKHSVGHTGGYYPEVEDRRFSISNYGASDAIFFEGSSTPGHTRTASFFTDYFLTGSPRSLETGRLVADRLLAYDLLTKPKMNYITAREPGWSLVSLTAAYRATGDQKYLDACNRLGDLIITKADGKGVWMRPLLAHQRGADDECGELSFPTAFQAAGMIELYKLTGRDDVRQNILETAYYIKDRLYRPEFRAFVHSPAKSRSQSPRAGGLAGTNLRYILAYAYGLKPDPAFLEPILDSFASTAANRQWCGTKVEPTRPNPHDFSASFYFYDEDAAAMDHAMGERLRNEKDLILQRAAPASVFPPTGAWEKTRTGEN